jgi:hypothetical protein
MKRMILVTLILGFLCILEGFTYIGIQASFGASRNAAGHASLTGDEGGGSKPFSCRLLGDEGGPTKPFAMQSSIA